MTPDRQPRARLADLARQARELLGSVRDSRWPGFAPPEPPSAKPAARQPRAPQGRPPAPACPANLAAPAATAAVRPRPAVAAPLQTEPPHPWRSLEEIAREVCGCTKCALHASRTRAVPGEGAPRARLMFVGEGPGADEDRLGRPFVGAAGQLLDRMIVAMGLAREEVFITNIVKCRPPGNRDPLEEEIAACIPYLRAQAALIRPEVICTLGRHATHALLERKDPLGRLRGRFFEYRGTPLLPTFHPSYLLRTPADKGLAWKDLQQVMQRLGLPLPAQGAEKDGTR